MDEDKNEPLHIIDTRNSLTRDELLELKRLAAMSKSAKLIFGIVFSIMMFVGFDQLISWVKKI